MNDKKEILDRVKLLMKYEMGKTLEENNKLNDNLLNEQISGIKSIFKIAGEELTGGLRNAIDDVIVFSKRYGGIEIVAADGSLKKATTSAELIGALHNGRVTVKTLSELHGGLLKSLETPPNVIEHIISQKGFETSWKRQMGHLSPEQMVIDLKQKGYPNEIIEKMMKKMGSMKNVMKLIPGLTAQLPEEALDQVDDKQIGRTEAIILSMTYKERTNPDIINGSRRKRIAAGSGTSVEEVNHLIKQMYEMRRGMKQMSKMQQRFGKLQKRR